MLVPNGAVVLIGVLCVVNLLLMLGVVRRLREHTAMIVAGHGAHTSAVGVPQGAVPRAIEGAALHADPSSRRFVRARNQAGMMPLG